MSKIVGYRTVRYCKEYQVPIVELSQDDIDSVKRTDGCVTCKYRQFVYPVGWANTYMKYNPEALLACDLCRKYRPELVGRIILNKEK